LATKYVDSTNGNDAWTGNYSTPQGDPATDGPYKTVKKFVQDGTRAAGDLCWVRRNMTYTEVTMLPLASGTATSPIRVRGDDGTVPAWTGDADVRPIIDFADLDACCTLSNRRYWSFERLHVKRCGSTDCAWRAQANSLMWLKDCKFEDNLNGGVLNDNSVVYLENYDCDIDHHRASQNIRGYTRISDSECDGGVEGFVNAGGTVEIIDSTAGKNTHNTQADIFVSQPDSVVRCRNVKLYSTDASQGIVQFGTTAQHARVHMEDFDQVKGNHKSFFWNGTVEKDTGVTRPGGGPSSAKVLPNANITTAIPLTLAEDWLAGDFQVWCPASPTTITVYMRATAAWSVYPTAAELYIQAEYWADATAKRAKSTKSTQVLSDGSTWVAFTTTFTPSQAGFVFVKAVLGKYESGKGIHVDIKPVVS